MAPLMHLERDDILEALLLGATDNEPGTSLMLAEEATLLGNDPTPQPEGAAKLELTAADPHGAWRQPLLPQPGFELPVSGPPLLKSGEPQVRIPREAWLDFTSMASNQMAIIGNKSTGKFENE